MESAAYHRLDFLQHSKSATKLVDFINQYARERRQASQGVHASKTFKMPLDRPKLRQKPGADSQASIDSNPVAALRNSIASEPVAAAPKASVDANSVVGSDASRESIKSPISEIHATRIPRYGKTLTPRPHQEQALRAIFNTFEKLAAAGKDLRTRVTLPCGAGKSLLGLWTRQKVLEDKRKEHDTSPAPSLVLVPSLDLVMQIKNDWLKQDPSIKYLCVCSDPDVDIQKPKKGHRTNKPNQTTKPQEIAQFLKANPNGVIFSTYQSFDKIKAAEASIPDFKFALTIFDEAHETAGPVGKQRSQALYNFNHKTERRLFLTATPRISTTTMNSADPVKTLVSMDDEEIFGPEAFKMSYREAVDAGIIVPYKIIGVSVKNDPKISQKIQDFLSEHPGSFDLQLHFFVQALKRASADYPGITHTMIFTGFRNTADTFQRIHELLYPGEFSTYLDAKLPAQTRRGALDVAEKESTACVTFARSGRTGLNFPGFDSILFTNLGLSVNQFAQALGRIVREDPNNPNKTCAYVIVPILPNYDMEPILRIINLMSQYDTDLASEIQEYVRGEVSSEVLEKHIQILNLEIPLIETKDLYTEVLKNAVPTKELQELRTFEDIQKLVQKHFGSQSPNLNEFMRDAYKRTGFGPDAIGRLLTSVEPKLEAVKLTDGDILGLIYGEISVDQLIIRKAMPSPSSLEELRSLVVDGYKSPGGLEIYSGFGRQKPSAKDFYDGAYVRTGRSVKTLIELVQGFEPKLKGLNIEARDLLKLIYNELSFKDFCMQYLNKGVVLDPRDFKAFQEIFKEGYIDPVTREKICPGFGTERPTLHQYTRDSKKNILMTPAEIEKLIKKLIPALDPIKLDKFDCIDLLYGERSPNDIIKSLEELSRLSKPQNFQDLQDLIKRRYGDKLPEATIFEATCENTIGLTIDECQGIVRSHFELAPESRLTVKKMLETIYLGILVKSSIVPKVVEPKHRIDSSSINDIHDLQALIMYGSGDFRGFGQKQPHGTFFINNLKDKLGSSKEVVVPLIRKILSSMIKGKNIPHGEDWLNANIHELLGFVYADNPRLHLATNLPTAHIIKNMPKETIQDMRNLFINGLTTEKGRRILSGFGDKQPGINLFQKEAEQKIGMPHEKFQTLFKQNVFPDLIISEPNTHESWLSPKDVQTKHLLRLIYSDDYRSLLKQHRDEAIVSAF
jgi:superfamily II DNA or RNA helicase